MEMTPRAALVGALALARRRAKQIASIDAQWELESAWAAETVMLDVARELGWEPLGWKIAATNDDLQRRLRVQGPVFGRTFAQYLSRSPSSFVFKNLLDPIVECEFMFKTKRVLRSADYPHSPGSVADAIECVYPGIEVGECRLFGASHIDPKLLIADAFGSGRYVIGSAIERWQDRLEAGIDVILYRNGEKRAEGNSKVVMGNPLQSVTWLANRLAEHGLDLGAGELVSSGSCTGMVRARLDDKVVGKFDDQIIEIGFE